MSTLQAQVELVCPIDRVNLTNTKYCLENIIKNSPFNEEESAQLARVHLWMKNVNEAQKVLKTFPKLTLKYIEIKILISWYQNKYAVVEKSYLYYKNKGFKLEDHEPLQYPYIMSLWKLDKKDDAIDYKNHALEKFPDNKILKKLELNQNDHKLIFDYLGYAENDSRSVMTTNLEYLYREDSLVLIPGYEFYSRKYEEESLTDANFKFMSKFQTSKKYWLGFGYHHSLSNIFIPRNTYITSLELRWAVKHWLQFEMSQRDFRKRNILVTKVKDDYTYLSWIFSGSIQIQVNDFSSRVYQLGATYNSKFFIPSLWYSFGKTDPTKPYLTRDLDSSFSLYGLKFSKPVFGNYEIQLSFENRSEPGYQYTMTGLSLIGKY